MAHVASVPTETEAAYLASLGACVPSPATTGSAIRLKSELQDFFRLCRLPWVADFLFSTEMNSLPALTAPANMRSAVSCTVHMTNVQCVSFGDHPFDNHLSGRFIFIPAFSVAEISVGFGVQECLMKCFADWCNRPGDRDEPITSHFRFVRDDKRGVLVIIYRDPESSLVKMEVMTHIGASVRRRTFCVFDQDKLGAALRTERGILHPEYVLPALKMKCTVVESRTCPFCGSPANFFCDCKLDIEIPKHPLDFSALVKNMTAFLGAYEGLTTSSVFEGGKEIMSANVGSVIHIQGGMDADLIDRLSRWAISDQLQGRKENPTALIMPAGAESNKGDKEADVIDMAIDNGAIVAQGSVGLPEVSASFFDPIANVTSSCSSGSGILLADSLEDTGPQVVPAQAAAVSPLFEHVTPETGPVGVNDEALDLVNKIAESPGIVMNELDLGRGAEQSMESASSEEQAVPTMDVVGSGFEQQGSKTVISGTRAIAPSAPVRSSGETEQDEKERRAQLRKQRNREAAQRSNLKRKIKNDTLKKALKETHAKAAELRARELALREENLELRKLTSS